MDTISIIITAGSVIFGGIITWAVSKYYYIKAGKELLAESQKLRLSSDLILYKLQYPEAKTQIKRNENGDVIGLIVETSAKA